MLQTETKKTAREIFWLDFAPLTKNDQSRAMAKLNTRYDLDAPFPDEQ
jgi:hypothetical protein